MDDEESTICRLFDVNRFSRIQWKIFFLIYVSYGIMLAVVRTAMCLQVLLAGAVLCWIFPVKRIVLRIMLSVLGIVIMEDASLAERDHTVRVIIANHISPFDSIILHALTNCVTPIFTYVPGIFSNILGLKYIRDADTSTYSKKVEDFVTSQLNQSTRPILLFPEGSTTNGSVALLRFSFYWGEGVDAVQPAVVKMWRPHFIDVAPTIMGSKWYTDCLWGFFVPFTLYTVKYLPVIRRDRDELAVDMVRKVEQSIAQDLSISVSAFTWRDKEEYEKRLSREPN